LRRLLIGLVSGVAALCGAAPFIIERVEAFGGAGGTSVCWKIGAVDGWTVPCPTAGAGTCNLAGTGTHTGTCIWYVSAAGNDATCTAETTLTDTPAAPCLTVGAASKALRTGKPDWMLLNRGDTWTVPAISAEPTDGNYFVTATSNVFCKRGRSEQEPMLVGSYGTGARPILAWSNVIASQRFFLRANVAPCYPGQIAFMDIDFYNYRADTGNGAYLYAAHAGLETGISMATCTQTQTFDGTCAFVLIENSRFRDAGLNLTGYQRTHVRRNGFGKVSVGSCADFAGSGVTQPATDYYIVENVFYKCGWDTDISPSNPRTNLMNIYSNATNHRYRAGSVNFYGNISTSAANTGIRNRQGGRIINNFLYENNIGIELGIGNSSRNPSFVNTGTRPPEPSASIVRWNVSMSNSAYTGVLAGHGLQILAIEPPTDLSYNLLAFTSAGTTDDGAYVMSSESRNVTGSGNIACGLVQSSDNVMLDNTLGTGGNSVSATLQADCSSPAVGSDPTRTVLRYDSEVLGGPGTEENFIACALANERGAPPWLGRRAEWTGWDARCTAAAVNAWIREGFGMQAVPTAAADLPPKF
jgi:hypothetical protein